MDEPTYPFTDPEWFPMNRLIEAATERYYQEHTTCVYCTMKTEENPPANEVLKQNRFSKKEASEKPINFMGSKAECNFQKDGHVLKINKTNGLKRTYATFTNDDDQERVGEDESLKKKKEKSKGCRSTKKHNPKQQLPMGAADTIFDLPQEFENKISEMGGNEITLVIQKSLYQTDLNPQHNRLSMPLKQIKNASFLREGELQILEKKQAIEVPLIQPSLELKSITLAKWNMPKISSTNSSYVLRSSWTKVAADNQLKAYDVVQVWSFRVKEELCMALVKV